MSEAGRLQAGGRDAAPFAGGSPEVEAAVMRVYEELKGLLARDDLDPSVRANLVEAMAGVSLVVHDLGLAYEMLYDLGV